MSNLTLLSITSVTLFALALSESPINSNKHLGTICHETPNLSVSQPHCDSFPPSATNAAHRRSTSS
ncbi:hypothetical protein ACKS0A_09266 [Histoplasma ohiense]